MIWINTIHLLYVIFHNLCTDKYGNEWFAKILESRKQVWVKVSSGNIFKDRINDIPKQFNPITGLKNED